MCLQHTNLHLMNILRPINKEDQVTQSSFFCYCIQDVSIKTLLCAHSHSDKEHDVYPVFNAWSWNNKVSRWCKQVRQSRMVFNLSDKTIQSINVSEWAKIDRFVRRIVKSTPSFRGRVLSYELNQSVLYRAYLFTPCLQYLSTPAFLFLLVL